MEVRAKFDRSWARGFEIVELVASGIGASETGASETGNSETGDGDTGNDGYRVRRRSDGSVLPTVFDRGDVREEKHRNDMWWI